jgi:hypothetical protein
MVLYNIEDGTWMSGTTDYGPNYELYVSENSYNSSNILSIVANLSS